MFASLSRSDHRRVHGRGNWIAFPYAEFDRLIPEFIIPLDPLLVPVPAESLSLVASLSSTMVFNSSGAPPPYENPQPEAGPSTSNTRTTRSQTRARGNAPDDDHAAVMLPRTRGRVRQHLREARVRRHQDASPDHRLPSLPSLLSVREIARLREQVEPVSFCLPAFIILVYLFLIFQPTRPCRNCFLAGRECQWVSWATKCQECARVRQGRCSFEESPEERMAHSEASYSWGRDSLTGKFFFSFSLLIISDFLNF